jgi:hypothetical protein
MNKPDSAQLLDYLKKNFLIRPAEWKRLQLYVPYAMRERGELTVYSNTVIVGLTPMNIYLLPKLAGLAKNGCRLVFCLRDFALSDMLVAQGVTEPESEYMNKQVDRIYGYLQQLGAPRERIHIIKFSEVWRRFVSYPALFEQYLNITGELRLEQFLTPEKIRLFWKLKHLINNPMDVFASVYFKKLFPELGIDIDVLMARSHALGSRREPLYSLTRQLLQQAGVIQEPMPIFINTPALPRITDIGLPVPMAGISERELLSLLSRSESTDWDKEGPEIIDMELKEYLDSFKVGKKSLTMSEAARWIRKAPKNEQLRALAKNLFLYFQIAQKKFGEKPIQYPYKSLRASEARDLGRVLKSKHLVTILQLADGTRDSITIARQLKIHPANLSKYVGMLESGGFLFIDENGMLHRKVDRLTIDLQEA